MNWKQTIPLLAALFLALLPVRSRAEDSDYWVLTDVSLQVNKTTYRDLYRNVGIPSINGADKRIWEIQKNLATHSSGTTVAWDDPPEKIPVGQETELAIRCVVTYPDNMPQNVRYSTLIFGDAHIIAPDCVLDFSRDGDYLVWKGKKTPRSEPDPRHLVLVVASRLTIPPTLEGASVSQTYTYTRYGDGNTAEDTIIAPPGKGSFTLGDIPWEWIIPAGLVAGGIGLGKKIKKPKPPKGGTKPSGKKKEPEKETPPSTYRMILWKDCGDTLVVGDAPVNVGARIEEITPDGQRIDRPDLTRMIRITAKKNAQVGDQHLEGKYMMAGVVAVGDEKGRSPGTATIILAFNGPYGRMVHNVIFRVEDAAAILVEPAITFAAGEGKTLFMEFALLGSLRFTEKLAIKLEAKAGPYFTAELEQDAETPGLFRVHLTEHSPEPTGPDAPEIIPGTIERYTCTIEALPPGKETPVRESFDIYRIHLGLRLEIRALKGYLVELGSTPENDIMPPKGSKCQKKYAESRVEWLLTVVDEQDGGKIKAVKPDAAPEFTFEDDFAGNMLFVEKGQNHAVPTPGQFSQLDGCFFRTFDGQGVPSPCETLKFEYATIGGTADGGWWGIIRPTAGYLISPNRSHVKVTARMTWRGQVFTRSMRVPLNSQPFRKIEVPEGGDFMRELDKWEKLDTERKNHLIDMQRKLYLDRDFAQLRPLFYKVTIMLEAHDKAFGFDEEDYQNLMAIWDKYCRGEIGTVFVAKQALAPDDENFEAAIATIAAMDRSIPAIACRIGLGIATGGASEVVLAPLSALTEMKEYVDKGGDSAFGAFAQCSIKIVGMELAFLGVGKFAGWAWDKTKKATSWAWDKSRVAGGKLLEKIRQFKAAKLEKAKVLADKAKQLGQGVRKAAETAKVSKALARRPAFSSAGTADKITQAAARAKEAVAKSEKLADTAVKKTLAGGKSAKSLPGAKTTKTLPGTKAAPKELPGTKAAPKELPGTEIPKELPGPKAPKLLPDNSKDLSPEELLRRVNENKKKLEELAKHVKENRSQITSALREEAAKVSRQDGERIVENFRRVMNNPTASKEEMRRATMALQGSKSAQEVLKTHPSDLLRSHYNAQMQQFYDDIDPKVIQRLKQKIKVKNYSVEEPEIRVFKGATGNAGDDLRLGKKIGADRDVTYQIKRADGTWADLSEDIMGEAYAEVVNQELYGNIPADFTERVTKTMQKLDQAVVHGQLGLESYGSDLGRIIDPLRQTEKLGDPERIAKTFVHKCKEWMGQGLKAHETAEQLFAAGYPEEALKVLGYGETLITEGVRQNVKQFNRILVPRIEAAKVKGVSLNYDTLKAKLRILESATKPPPKGVKPITLEQARLTLAEQFNATLDSVVEECAQAILDVNKVL